METISLILRALSVAIGIIGLVIGRKYFNDWIRLHRNSCGLLISDTHGIKQHVNDINDRGFVGYMKDMKKLIYNKIGNKSYNIIATPAEVDYLFPFLLSHTLNKKFCSVHTDSDWPSSLTRFRYNNIKSGDRVLLVAVILTSGKYLIPAIDQIIDAGGTVCGVFTIIEGRPDNPEETTTIKDYLRKMRNVPFFAIYPIF